MAELERIWLPLVDEPIGSIVERMLLERPEIDALVRSPRRLLAFRTFAYIRIGLVLGQLLFDEDLPPYDGSEAWVEALLRDGAHRAKLERELQAVADEIAADPAYGDDEPLCPDAGARERFRAFARGRLDAP